MDRKRRKTGDNEENMRILGLDVPMDSGIIESVEKDFLKMALENSEPDAQEALDLVKKALGLIRDDEFRSIIIVLMLMRLPAGLQKVLIEEQENLIKTHMMSHFIKNTEKSGLDIEKLYDSLN